MEVKDSVGNLLNEGDTVIINKTLKIKGMTKGLKRGEKIKNIRLTDDPTQVECRIGKSQVVLLTSILKKA